MSDLTVPYPTPAYSTFILFQVYFRLPRPPPPEMPESLKKKLAAQQQ